MSLIRKHVAVLQAWACLALVTMSKNWEVHDVKRLIVEYKKDQLGLHKVS